ncbi:thioesterase II family protein [Streptomyces sp. NPDC001714]|uniref:thioesterase II family protein n=1 Tax=Streptomyces sp. NPDC001714 TaxID=3364603 RepID=UPI0036A228BA
MPRSNWFRGYVQAPPGVPRLLCLPHAGGSASFYYPLAQRLGAETETLAVQYPGRQDRRSEEPVAEIGRLAQHVVDALSGEDTRPLALFGHSMGAVVAFETALRLSAAGRPPAVLIVSGRRAPSRQVPETVHRRDDAGVLLELRRLAGTDARVLGDPELLAMILPAIRADYRALAGYPASQAVVDCPVVALTGDRDPVTPVEDALAWREHTTAEFASAVFPGGHFYLAEHQDEVVRLIRDAVRSRV